MPPLGREVRPCRDALLGLADLLEQAGYSDACGLARARWLITDGAGPLYCDRTDRSLIEAIWWIADGLSLAPFAETLSTQRPS